MTIANIPNARVLLINADGTLMEGCCCLTCAGNCCCDTNVEAWFQEPLTVSISSVREATPESPTLPSLQCLVGDWVLPYKSNGVGSGRCVWENTFSPTTVPDGLVFRISASSPLTLNESSSPTPTACLSVTITVLSCKDCNGEVMNQTPVVLFENTSANCSYSYSPSAGDIPNCGCGDAEVPKVIDGSWNSSFSSINVASLTDEEQLGYFGHCWYHPDAQDRTAILRLSNARIVTVLNADVTGSFTGSIETLNREVGYEKDYTVADTVCEYFPTGPVLSEFDERLTPATSVAPDEYCGWFATLKDPYTDVSGISVDGASSYTSYYTTHAFVAGCQGQDPVFIRLGQFVHTGITYYVEVQIEVILSGPSSCDFYLGVTTPGTNCSLNTSVNYCDVSAVTCGTDVGTYTLYSLGLPSSDTIPDDPADIDIIGPDDVDVGTRPGFSDNGSTNISDNCECPASLLRVCTAYDMNITFPTRVKAQDYAPDGARYEIICRISNEDGTQTDYRFVYTKSLGELQTTPTDYPQGIWTLDWSPPADVFNKSWCGCGDYASAIITSAKDRIQILPGDVLPSTLHGDGIFGITGVDGSPFITREVTVYQRPEFGIDPCCDCSDNVCTDRHCSNCACDGESSDNPPDAPGPCSRNLTQRERSDYCCPCASENTAVITVEQTDSGSCGSDSWSYTYFEVLACDVSDLSSLNPDYISSDNTNGTYELSWNCGGKCVSTWTYTLPTTSCSVVVSIGHLSSPPCAAYNCDKQRWEPPAYDVEYPPGTPTEVNLTSCTGSRLSVSNDHAIGSLSRVESLTENFSTVPGCSSNGHGSTRIVPVDDCTSHSYDYNCVATTASGYWKYRRVLPIDEATGITSSYSPVALFYYFPGNGDADCSSLNGTMSIKEMGPDWATDDVSRNVYLYTEFVFNVASDGRCGGSTEPIGLIDVVCPIDVGILVDVSMNGTVNETYDADCLSADCISPLGPP